MALDIHGDFYDFDPTGRRGEPRKRRTATKKATVAKKLPPKRSSRNAKRDAR